MDLVILFFLCNYIYKKASKKDLQPTKWVLYLIGLWLLGSIIGMNIASLFYVFDPKNVLSVIPFALISYPFSFAGFHLLKTVLDKKNDLQKTDINSSL